MELKELKSILRAHPMARSRLILPDGREVPAHFHITEVGHLTKRFIDCGGKLHDQKHTCVLQTWVSEDDRDHRLNAGTFAKILDLGQQVLPHDDVDVEVEYEGGGVSQYPIAAAQVDGEKILLNLSSEHADCLAKERCGINGESCGPQDHAKANAPVTSSLACC